jgi:hypothetical protein
LSRGMSFAWRFPAMKLLSSVLSMKIVVSTFHKHLLWLTHSQLDWYKHHCNNNRQQAWVVSWWAASISGIITVWWRCEMFWLRFFGVGWSLRGFHAKQSLMNGSLLVHFFCYILIICPSNILVQSNHPHAGMCWCGYY